MPQEQTPEPQSTSKPPAAGLPLVAPDAIEQELGEHVDNIVPSYGYQHDPMVGIGGSAGAIAALQAFFESMPPQSGITFVVVLHLAPDHPSSITDMIRKWTKMNVVAVEDGTRTQRNTVYVIPPGKHLTAVNGH